MSEPPRALEKRAKSLPAGQLEFIQSLDQDYIPMAVGLQLKGKFQGELDLAFRNRSSNQLAGGAADAALNTPCQRRTVRRKNIRVAVSGLRWRKVRVIDDVEHLHPKLHVKGLRDFLDRDILEDREVEACNARTDDGISPRISSQVEAD